jgi:hypothetical protein
MQQATDRSSGALGALRRAAGQRKDTGMKWATERCSGLPRGVPAPKHQRPPKGFQKHREGAPRGSAGHQTVQRATERRSGHREVFRCTGCTGTYSGTVKAMPERPPKGDPKHQGAPRGSAGHYTASHQQAVQRATNNGCSRLPRGVTMHWKHQNAKQDSESRNGAPEAAERVP